ncbi:MAG: MBL fold metallo-hydrolase [Desulfobacteraceae bacterium]|jgi:7,8-dihydropterin-6-yl-methyl-4-(beta-D-ribofuranosyl)aminobenzene 5'-phosphate synthase|nr:MAG: MBL fold metallo-hydrolase [Desulfobacteraceae bacterium]
MTFLYILIGIVALFGIIVFKKTKQLEAGKTIADRELSGMRVDRLSPFGSVKSLSILPLVDFYADKPDLKTEAGVSYLIRADETTILLDTGLNAKKEHPSPLLHNMEKLGVSEKEIDMIFFSHLHLDHVGGMKNQKDKTFSLSQGPVELGSIPVYAPAPVTASAFNPGPETRVIREPAVIKPGIATIGVIPRFLFLMGNTPENALAINVEGKGIVLIIGCGHQTIERIIERAKALFDEPIYAIIGGLHFPVTSGRIMIGPINIQRVVGSDRPPWRGLNETDVEAAIAAIKTASPKIVALSPHDSCDWSLDRFRQALGDAYVDLKVGREIRI